LICRRRFPVDYFVEHFLFNAKRFLEEGIKTLDMGTLEAAAFALERLEKQLQKLDEENKDKN